MRLSEIEIKPKHAFILMLMLVLIVALTFVMTGCKVVEREVPVVVEHSTSSRSVDVMRDTLMMRDSVYHYIQGDTLRIERWHYTTDIRQVLKTDTVRDTVPRVITVTEIKEVAHGSKWWPLLAVAAWGILIIVVVIRIIHMVK